MFNRFTERARKVILLAKEEAKRFNHDYIGTEHILLGLVREGEGVAAAVLENLGLDPEKIRIEVEKLVQPGPTWYHASTATPAMMRHASTAISAASRGDRVAIRWFGMLAGNLSPETCLECGKTRLECGKPGFERSRRGCRCMCMCRRRRGRG